MDIKFDIDLNISICPHCYGIGKLKAMQSAMTYEGVTIRAQDTIVKCNKCKGTGLLKQK